MKNWAHITTPGLNLNGLSAVFEYMREIIRDLRNSSFNHMYHTGYHNAILSGLNFIF